MDTLDHGTNAAGSQPEGQPGNGHTPQAKDSPRRPVWTRTKGRVDGSVWRHSQPGGTRYTFSPSRSYLSKRDGQWKRDSFFDVRDLADLIAVCREAEEAIRGFQAAEETDAQE